MTRLKDRYGGVSMMDVDHFLTTHQPSWTRLAELSRRATGSHARRVLRRSKVGALDAAEIDELVRLYQRASSDLSYCRTYFSDPTITARLTTIVAEAHAVIHGTRTASTAVFGRFFSTSFPGAVWSLRRFLVVSALITFVPALVLGTWLTVSGEARDASAPEVYREAYLARDFEDYYSSEPAEQFTTEVFINNAQVGFYAFGVGIFLCIPTALVLAMNGFNLGFAGGLFTAAGQWQKFWGLILPHGLLELTGVVIAGAAGLALGWALVAPGDRRRSEALAEQAKRSAVLVMGLVPLFLVAGLIEGFITGRPWHSAVRVGIGATVWLAFCAYILVQGKASERSGFIGSLEETDEIGLVLPLVTAAHGS